MYIEINLLRDILFEQNKRAENAEIFLHLNIMCGTLLRAQQVFSYTLNLILIY